MRARSSSAARYTAVSCDSSAGLTSPVHVCCSGTWPASSAALRGGQHLKRVALRPGRLVFLNQPGADHPVHRPARDVRVIVVVLLGEVFVRHGAVHPHVGDGVAVAVGAGAPVAGLRLARVVLASVAVGAGVGLRAVLLGPARRGRVFRKASDAGPVLVGPSAIFCPCAAVVARLSVLVAVVGHGRGRVWFAGGGVQPGARLDDAGLPLGGELVAFLGGAFLARPVLRVEPGKVGGSGPLVAGCGLGGVVAVAVRRGAFF